MKNIAASKARSVDSTMSPTATRTAPFAGLKVLDLTWAISGPSTARMLCDYGADVVHIETGSRQDAARSVGPYLNDQKEPEYAGLYFTMNTGKKGMLLDLRRVGKFSMISCHGATFLLSLSHHVVDVL